MKKAISNHRYQSVIFSPKTQYYVLDVYLLVELTKSLVISYSCGLRPLALPVIDDNFILTTDQYWVSMRSVRHK